MSYFKKIFFFFLIFIIIFIILKITVFAPVVKLLIKSYNINTTSSLITVEGTIVSYKDGVYKINFFITKDKYKFKLLPEEVFVLKKNQSTTFLTDFVLEDKLEYKISKVKDKFGLIILVEELYPKSVLRYKKSIIITPIIKNSAIIPISQNQISTTTNFSKTLTEPIQEKNVKYDDKKLDVVDQAEQKTELVKEKVVEKQSLSEVKYNIIISTENFLPEYFYNEIIETKAKLINNVNETVKVRIDILLKNDYGIMISSNVFNVSLKGKEVYETNLQLKIGDFIIPGIYNIEYIYHINNKKYSILTPSFKITDRKPKIVLTDIPKVKYKNTNTILVEVSDDRGVKIVNFIELDMKTLKEKVFQMILVAGDSKFGLYSFTTPKIDRKGIYKFFIRAEDNSGNITETEVYELKISG